LEIEMADSTHSTKGLVSKRDVMIRAWENFRSMRARSAEQLAAYGFDGSFAESLRWAWKIEKLAAARVAAEMKEAKSPNAPAIRAIKAAIADLQYKGFKHNIASERHVLETQLAALRG
jgi:hypothetical protein